VSDPLAFRLADESDLERLREIYNQAIHARQTADTEPVTLENRRAWLAEHPARSYPAHVAERAGSVIGYSSLSRYRGGRKALRFTAEISYFVDHAHLGEGVGTALLEHAIREARAREFRTLVAILLGSNGPSIGLLKKFGFDEWGRLPDAADFDGETVDHLIYGRRLDDPDGPS
jgi:phosphinothricin acetyltransferase